MGVIKVNPVMLTEPVEKLCAKPYYNHLKGCPNFGKKKGCPPNQKRYDKAYDLNEPVMAIYNIFAFGDHVRKMRMLHPDWSQRQVECCLYWQGKARKQLKEIIELFQFANVGRFYSIEMVPEALGVNVTQTIIDAKVSFRLEWPPKEFAFQVALAGIKKSEYVTL